MNVNINVYCDGNWDNPEVQISGSWEELVQLGSVINRINESIILDLPDIASEIYPVCLKRLFLDLDEEHNSRITVSIDEKQLTLTGTKEALSIIGESLTNYFDSDTKYGERIRFDYYEGNEVLNETNCVLLFVCHGD